MQLTKGANLTLPPAREVTVTCTWTPHPGLDADLSALLLVGGRVRDDTDFVFYNQPASVDRRVVHGGKRTAGQVCDRIVVDLAGFDDAVGAVAFAVSLGRDRRRPQPRRATLVPPPGPARRTDRPNAPRRRPGRR